jgi:hypothetical protein
MFILIIIVGIVIFIAYFSNQSNKATASIDSVSITNSEHYRSIRRQMENVVCDIACAGDDSSELNSQLLLMAQQDNAPIEICNDAMLSGLMLALDKMLEEGVASDEIEKRVVKYVEGIKMTEEEFESTEAFKKTHKTLILRDIMEGKVPNRFKALGTVHINFQKNETLIWGMSDVPYLEEKTSRSYVGASQGISIRVAKGLYYRAGGFKGQPIEKSNWVHMDTGVIAITNKHLYFAGCKKSFRHPFSKIINIIPFDEGIGIFTENRNAKPKAFLLDDGLFMFNLIKNLSQL